MTNKDNSFTTPQEGLDLLKTAEAQYGSFDKIPEVDFVVDVNPKKYKTKLKSIRLTEYIIDGYDDLAKKYGMKPQTLIKAVLEEYLQKNHQVEQ